MSQVTLLSFDQSEIAVTDCFAIQLGLALANALYYGKNLIGLIHLQAEISFLAETMPPGQNFWPGMQCWPANDYFRHILLSFCILNVFLSLHRNQHILSRWIQSLN